MHYTMVVYVYVIVMNEVVSCWFIRCLFPIGIIGEFRYLHICRPGVLIEQMWSCHTFLERSERDLLASLVPRAVTSTFRYQWRTHSMECGSVSCSWYPLSLSFYSSVSPLPLYWICMLPVSATSAWIPYNDRIYI